ncbi:PAS domain-containing protein [Vibrio sp. 10N.261.55.A7]|uniref:PAS domain-containing protein n=1 Tax=Vibrio sp. 10N.261.55.A7 TaxID=1880851 RepID=UPI001F539390|nr:PAS domain-containing protein [Vibrio sp. 10N.261.55.A7]
MNKRNMKVIDEEVEFSEDVELVSTTDKRGIITYANDEFYKVAGYTPEELLNKNHNIIRHPDMPKAAFKDLWDHLKGGLAWCRKKPLQRWPILLGRRLRYASIRRGRTGWLPISKKKIGARSKRSCHKTLRLR